MKDNKHINTFEQHGKNLNISDVSDSSENKQKLFDILINFGFKKTEKENLIFFKNNDEIFVYPNTELYTRHYITTRKQLDMNGWMDQEEFNSVFDFLNYY